MVARCNVYKLKQRKFTLSIRKCFYILRWFKCWIDYQKKSWTLHPCWYLKLYWMCSGAACASWSYFEYSTGPGDLTRCLKPSFILRDYVPVWAVEKKRGNLPAKKACCPAWYFPVCIDIFNVCRILYFLFSFLHPCKYVPPLFSYHFSSFLCTAKHTNLCSAPQYNAIDSLSVSKAVLWKIVHSYPWTMLASVPNCPCSYLQDVFCVFF